MIRPAAACVLVALASAADVFRTAAEAAASFRRAAGPAAARCFEQLARSLKGVTDVSVRVLPFPGVGVRRFAFRYAVTSTRDNKRGYTDHIAWDRGRASSGLIVGTPPRRAFEVRLARRIDARMRP